MTSYTGTVKHIDDPSLASTYPVTNPFNHFRLPAGPSARRVYKAVLQGTEAAIGTDDYTYTLFVADRAMVIDAVFVLDPTGVAVDTTNDNNFNVNNGSTTGMFTGTTGYSIVANEWWEIPRAETVANRTLAAGDTVTLVVDGDNTGQVINQMFVVVVCHVS